MSGHNPPHGRLGQPNSTWNQLQVPSYIPRQPQLAHMSSERPLARSPLTWHTPSHQEQIYNFMTANHKNNLDINPLLPTFGRNSAMPLGSVDLSLSSAARNTPSPKNIHPPAPPPPTLNIGNLIDPIDLFPPKGPIVNTLNNRSPSNTTGVIQSTASLKDRAQNVINKSNTDATTVPGGLYVKDAKQINNDIGRNSRDGLQHLTEPSELVKDALLHAIHHGSVTLSPKRSFSPPRAQILSNQSPPRSRSPPPALIPVSELPSAAITVNNTIQNVPSKTPISEKVASKSPSPPPVMNNNNASNEDSIDSNSSKVRRKRKPDKTTRVSSENIEEILAARINNVPSVTPDDVVAVVNHSVPTIIQQTIEKEDNRTTAMPPPTENAIVEPPIPEPSKPDVNLIPPPPTEEKIEIPKEIPVTPEFVPGTVPLTQIEKDLIDENHDSTNLGDKSKENTLEIEKIISPARRTNRRKKQDDSDDCETIDKIAAMISSTAEEEDNKVETDTSKCNGDVETKNATTECVDPANAVLDPLVKSYEEVENKLEEMFAGIVESTPQKTTEPPPQHELINELSEKSEDSITKKPIKRGNNSKTNSTPPKKKKKVLKKKPNNAKNNKSSNNKKNAKNNGKNGSSSSSSSKSKSKLDASTSEIINKYKGPYIQVKLDGAQTVINAPINDDDADKAQNKTKKFISNHNSSEKNKIRGLHVSTLSMKYDADTTDTSWMCVFCKMGPHKSRLGDLFGPYIITTTSSDFGLSQVDPSNDSFNVKRTKQSMVSKNAAIALPETSQPKKKRKNIPELLEPTKSEIETNVDVFFGMVKADDESYEVWVHEDCLVWAPGVYIIGTRIVGLEAAIWSCSRHLCTICSSYGAVVSCLHRGCTGEAHIVCARKSNWKLDDEFKCKCELHGEDS